jgi:hypothetical protein
MGIVAQSIARLRYKPLVSRPLDQRRDKRLAQSTVLTPMNAPAKRSP